MLLIQKYGSEKKNNTSYENFNAGSISFHVYGYYNTVARLDLFGGGGGQSRAPKARAARGSGGMLPQRIFKIIGGPRLPRPQCTV